MRSERSVFFRFGIAIFLLVTIGVHVVSAKDAPTTQSSAVISDQDFDAALEKANAALGSDPTERDQTLVSVAARFQSIDVCTTPGRNMWSIRTLNERGKGIDALRFTVPDGMNTHFYWAFSVPKLKSWYILPVHGDPNGFEEFNRGQKYRLPVVLNQHLILQHVPNRLTAGEDYLLWFQFDGSGAEQAYISIVLLDDDRKGTVPEIESAIGLKRQGK